MADLVVLAYDHEETAKNARKREALIGLDDAVVVVRRENGKVQIKQAVNIAGGKALSGAFWGALIGLIS